MAHAAKAWLIDTSGKRKRLQNCVLVVFPDFSRSRYFLTCPLVFAAELSAILSPDVNYLNTTYGMLFYLYRLLESSVCPGRVLQQPPYYSRILGWWVLKKKRGQRVAVCYISGTWRIEKWKRQMPTCFPSSFPLSLTKYTCCNPWSLGATLG